MVNKLWLAISQSPAGLKQVSTLMMMKAGDGLHGCFHIQGDASAWRDVSEQQTLVLGSWWISLPYRLQSWIGKQTFSLSRFGHLVALDSLTSSTNLNL